MKKYVYILLGLILIVSAGVAYRMAVNYFYENDVLKQVIERLQADSRIAQVLVTDVRYDEGTGKVFTKIKFLEYDAQGASLEPRYFTFPGNIIQFQSLVIRFNDINIRQSDKLKGRSAYLFWKVFMLDGENTKEYEITRMNEIPRGYEIDGLKHSFEAVLWKNFWTYALEDNAKRRMGIKNAQIEAPGTIFVPGTLYTISIEHDGGMRIDSKPLPAILRGEHIP